MSKLHCGSDTCPGLYEFTNCKCECSRCVETNQNIHDSYYKCTNPNCKHVMQLKSGNCLSCGSPTILTGRHD